MAVRKLHRKESKMKTRNFRLGSVMAAALFALGSHIALAQPGGERMGHGRGQGLALEGVLASVKAQLNLNTSQQLMWDNVTAQTKAARDSGRASMDQVRSVLTAELAKAEPDFAAVASAADAAQAGNQALHKQVRDQWLALYATFSPAQKVVVRDAVKTRVARMDAFRERMKERMQSRAQGSNG
jgi:hypothetical protein